MRKICAFFAFLCVVILSVNVSANRLYAANEGVKIDKIGGAHS